MSTPGEESTPTGSPDSGPDAARARRGHGREDDTPRAPTPPPRPSRDDPDVLWLAPGVWVRRGDLGEQFVRGSGPGGQCVNKVASAVLLRVAVSSIHGLDERRLARLRTIARKRITRDGDIVIQGREFRSQRDNRRACEERLIDIVKRAWELPRERKKSRPSRAAKERRLKAKRRQSEKKSRRREKRPGADD